ncbi:hypothetical protein QMP26_14225 [Enterocloster clostridioformis]
MASDKTGIVSIVFLRIITHPFFAVLAATPARRSFDKRELAKRGENYDKKSRISWITAI